MVDYSDMVDLRKPRKRFLYSLTQLLVFLSFKILFGLKVSGRKNVPDKGSFILASNHQSWFDPPIIGASCPRELHYAAKKELFDIFLLGSLVRYFNSIPVKRSGFDRAALVKLTEELKRGNCIIIFPEGKRFKDGRLHPAKPGVGLLALQLNTPILPCYIEGSNKLNRQVIGRRLRLVFGKPFMISDLDLGDIDGKDAYRAIADLVMVKIAELGGIEAHE